MEDSREEEEERILTASRSPDVQNLFRPTQLVVMPMNLSATAPK